MPLKSSVNWVASSSSVAAFGWVRSVSKLPRSRRLYHNAYPSPSHHSNLTRSRRLLKNRNQLPSRGSRAKAERTRPVNPSKSCAGQSAEHERRSVCCGPGSAWAVSDAFGIRSDQSGNRQLQRLRAGQWNRQPRPTSQLGGHCQLAAKVHIAQHTHRDKASLPGLSLNALSRCRRSRCEPACTAGTRRSRPSPKLAPPDVKRRR